MPWLLILDSSFPIFVISNGGYEPTPLQVVRVPLLVGSSILHQTGRQTLSFFLIQGLLAHFTCPCFCLALPTVTQFCDWSHSSWGSLSASINGHQCCSLCLTYMFILRSAATSCYLWSLPILSGCSGRCPWQKLQLPVFPPQGSFIGRSLGDCLTTFLLWHPLSFTSYRGSLAWGGAGTPVPCMMAAHTEGECQSLMQWEEVSFGGGLMTFHVGSSLHKRGHQPWFDPPPPKSLLPTYPWSSSSPSSHPPSLVPIHQASSSLHLSLCCSTVSVCVLLPLIGLAPPIGQSSIYPIQKLCTSPHTWQRPLLWGPHCCQWWGRQSWLGA